MKTKLIEDLSILSNIDIELLSKLFDKFALCIEERVYEDRIKEDFSTEIDLGFASIVIKNEDGKEKIKLIPTPEFIKILKRAESKKSSQLKKRLERSVTTKMLELLRDID